MTSFRVRAIPAEVLDRARRRGLDDHGNAVEQRVDTEGGAPLRCCLRESRPGERIALIAYRPSARGGPYAEVGPVFVHAARCPGYPAPTAYPAGFRHRRQLVRSYGADGRIVDAEVVDGADAERAIGRLLARPEVAEIHSRNLLHGCFMFAVERD